MHGGTSRRLYGRRRSAGKLTSGRTRPCWPRGGAGLSASPVVSGVDGTVKPVSSRPRKRQPGPRRPEGERTWSVDDALREYERLIAWLPTRDGRTAAYMAYHHAYMGKWPDELSSEDARWKLAEASCRDTAATLAGCPPIWCDPPMVDLIAAAADTYPPEPFLEHNLPAPDGIVIFAKPLPAVWEDQHDEIARRQLRAISWCSGLSVKGEHVLSIAGWDRRIGVERYRQPKLLINYTGLRMASYVMGVYGAPPMDQAGGPAGTNRILQTFAALSRTPLVRDETSAGSKAARQAARRTGRPDPHIRRVQLRRPEHGQEELDAARAARAGTPPRGHWVRGHWKQQWHPSIEEHRTIWISGYPRGDFGAGTVSGTRVLIASDRHDDHRS